MEEKVLIKSEKYNVKKVFKIIFFIGLAMTIILFICKSFNFMSGYSKDYNEHEHHYGCLDIHYKDEMWDRCYGYLEDNDLDYGENGYFISEYLNEFVWCNGENTHTLSKFDCPKYYSNAFAYSIHKWSIYFDWYYYLIPIVALAAVLVLLYLWLRSYELTVTDKRVFGKVAFGRRVDLPIDSVSAISSISLLKGVSVSTSSGRISFLFIKNTKQIYDVINNLLIERQKKKPKTETTTIIQNSDEADKLKKYKDLLDSGVITQEEFDAKKKQLLGL